MVRQRAGCPSRALHDSEVVRHGKVEVLGLHQQRQVVIDAVVTDLEQEIARLATAEGRLHRL